MGGLFRRTFHVAFVVLGAFREPPHMQIESNHLADRIGIEQVNVAKVLVAVQQHAELRAPVAEVVVGDEVMAEESQQLRQRVADDRAAQMADVQRLGDVRRRVIDDEGLRRRGRDDAEPFVVGDRLQLLGQPFALEPQIDEAGPGDFGLFEHVAEIEPADDLGGDVARLLAEDLAERHRAVGLIVAELRIRGRLDELGVLGRLVGQTGECVCKLALQLFEQIH